MGRLLALLQALFPFSLPLHYSSIAITPPLLPLQQQQLQASLSNAHLRPATEMDLDDITTVVVDAFAPGALYRYAFPQLDQFKQYHWKCMREAVGKNFAELPEGGFVNVISVPISHASVDVQDRRTSRVVAVAGWKIIESQAEHSNHRDEWMFSPYHAIAKCSDHLDTNITRALDFSRQFSVAEKQYVSDYPHKQMYLATLATHPDWDGHGFGAAHCHWGMELAKTMDVPNTLIATPAGWPLYDSLGFKSVANITIKTLDWPEDLWFEYMRHEN